jgi:hypothetical protein
MKTIIIILAILFIFWYLNKKSTSNYFYNSDEKLHNDLILILQLYKNFKFDTHDRIRFTNAFNYFAIHPKEYNGTSVINDRFMIANLEPQSVVHDYDWIKATSLKELYHANLYYAKSLRKVNVNWLYVWGFIFTGLSIVAVFKSIKYIKF